jgi:hypothetical protein
MPCVVRRRKKSLRLEEARIVTREEYGELNLDAKAESIRALIPIGLERVQHLLEEEVTELAGGRYERKRDGVSASRHGSNPGTVRLAGQKIGWISISIAATQLGGRPGAVPKPVTASQPLETTRADARPRF